MPARDTLKRKASTELSSPRWRGSPQNTSYLTRKRYKRRRLLVMTWEDHDHDEQALEEEMGDLAYFYRQFLNFQEVERWRIPERRVWQGRLLEDDSCRQVRDHIKKFWERYPEQEDEHLVIYYGGHGRMKQSKNKARGSYLELVSGGKGDQFFQWNAVVHNYTFRGNKDCTVILDACGAGASITGNASPFNEVIAACSDNQKTNDFGQMSFTRRLLRACDFNGPFTTNQWYEAVRDVSAKEREVMPCWHSYEDGREIWYEPALLCDANIGQSLQWLRSRNEQRLSETLQELALARTNERRALEIQQQSLDLYQLERRCVQNVGLDALPPSFKQEWLEREKKFKLRYSLISSGMKVIWNRLGLSSDEAPSQTDIQSMAEDVFLTDPWDPEQNYAAYRRVKDQEARNKISKCWVEEEKLL